jgi:HEAT repeat protein
LDTSHLLLLAFLGLVLLAGFLHWIGVLGWAIPAFQGAFDTLVEWGFLAWKNLLAWADWIRFLGLTAALLIVGQSLGVLIPLVGVLVGGVLLAFGVITCLACIDIEQERAEVGRGYKTLHNPVKGQELALNLAHYGPRVGVLLLGAATLGAIIGFAQLNESLYYSVGHAWYSVTPEREDFLDLGDFLAYTIFNLLRVLDLIDLFNSLNRSEVIHPDVRQALWPSKTLLAVFKTFFTLVLLQQIFSALGRGRQLRQTVRDFWSPHPPIRERASGWLPLYGSEAVPLLLASLRSLDAVTAEQRAFLPRVIADIGPAASPALVRHLHDSDVNVRAIAVSALGMLRAGQAVPELIRLADDPSEFVRQSLAEALGMLGSDTEKPPRTGASLLDDAPPQRRWLMHLFPRPRPRRLHKIDPVPLAVIALRHALRDAEPAVRTVAAQSLGRIGTAAAAATTGLIAALEDPSDAVRCQAAASLSQVGGASPGVVDALKKRLNEPNPAMQVAVAHALGALSQDAASAAPALVPLLRAADEVVRQAAAAAVNQIGTIPDEALRQLTEGLRSSDSLVRSQTAEALGSIGPAAAGAAPLLVQALADQNDRVRAKVAEALGKLGESAAKAVPQLVRALKDQDNWVSALAAEALGEIGSSAEGGTPAQVIPALVRSLRHANAQVRGKAAESLGKLGEPARTALGGLEETAAKDENEAARKQALWALGEIGQLTEAGARLLVAAVQDPHPETRAIAVEALGKDAGHRADSAEAVVRALDDSNDLVRIEAARTLMRWNAASPSVILGLSKLLQGANPAAQVQAAQALGRLGAQAAAAGPALLQTALQSGEDVRESALRALALIQPPEAVDAFRAGLVDARAEIRKLASAALLKIGSVPEGALPDVIQALRDPEVRVRANAAGLLAKQDSIPADAVPLLLDCLTEADDALRMNAALALRTVSSPKVVAAYEVLIVDVNMRLQLLAADVLLLKDVAHPQAIQVVSTALADSSPRIRRAALCLVGVFCATVPVFLEALRDRAAAEEDPELSDLASQLLEAMESALAEEKAVAAEAARN